jgi:hypothetical protein
VIFISQIAPIPRVVCPIYGNPSVVCPQVGPFCSEQRRPILKVVTLGNHDVYLQKTHASQQRFPTQRQRRRNLRDGWQGPRGRSIFILDFRIRVTNCTPLNSSKYDIQVRLPRYVHICVDTINFVRLRIHIYRYA